MRGFNTMVFWANLYFGRQIPKNIKNQALFLKLKYSSKLTNGYDDRKQGLCSVA